jgi:hypothetical protein
MHDDDDLIYFRWPGINASDGDDALRDALVLAGLWAGVTKDEESVRVTDEKNKGEGLISLHDGGETNGRGVFERPNS